MVKLSLTVNVVHANSLTLLPSYLQNVFFYLFLDRLLHTDHLPLLHPRLLHRSRREQAEEEDGRGEDQTEEGGLCRHVGRRGLLRLLPAQHLSPSGAAGSTAEQNGGHGAHRGAGVRRPHGFVQRRLPARPAGLLLLPLGL